ncbi:hypothetical protein ACOMHN_043450 [Nucella lapillus]
MCGCMGESEYSARKRQRKFVRSHLSESVKDDLDCYPKEHLETLENIWSVLEKAYGDQRPVQQLLATFNSHEQYPGEGVRDFSNRVNKAFRDFTARQRAEGQRPLNEHILRDKFISGLQDGILMRQVRAKTMEGPDLSFIDVRLYAIKWELQETNMRRPAPHVEAAVASAEPQHALTDLTKMITRSTTPVCSQQCPVDLQHVDCTAEQKAQLERLVLANRDLFCSDDDDLGYTEKVMHRMRLKDDVPVASTFHRIPPTQLQEVKEHIQTLLSKKIIQQSSSPYASPVVIVRKKDGSIRLCVDYRRLNSKTIPDAYPLHRIDDSLDALGGAKMFSTLDLASGYHQVAMSPEDRQKTAFITPFGLFEYLRMPMGLSTAPTTFQRLMQMTMNDLAFQILLVYLDDLLIYSRSFEEHLQRLQTVFDRLREVDLTLNPKKCHLVRAEVEYLGYTISGEGIATSKDKVTAVKSWPAPKTLHDLRSFLGFASYYRRFVLGFAKVAKPLHQLISQTYQKEKGQKRKSKKVDVSRDWNAGCQSAFQALKNRLTSAPVLGYVDFSLPFILETDASLDGLGAVLSQEQNGKRRVIAYASRSLRPGERMMKNYSSMKLELLALKWAMCDIFRYYLFGAHTEVYTDNNPLSHLQTAKLGAVEQRWAAELASFEFSVKYRAGRENANADALSRNPVEEPEEEEEFTAVSCAHEVGQPGMFATTIDPVGTPLPDFESIIESPQQKEPGKTMHKGEAGHATTFPSITP